MATATQVEPEVPSGNKKTTVPDANVADTGIITDTPEKTYYSRLSVWLMVLFSGLAIGSDGLYVVPLNPPCIHVHVSS